MRETVLMLLATLTGSGTAIGTGVLSRTTLVAAPQAPETGGEVQREPARVTHAAGETKTMTATVEAIDREKRTVTLKGEQGKTKTVDVPADAPNFDRLKKGDKVKMSYQESAAVSVRRPGEVKPEMKTKETSEQIQGAKPGQMLERQQTISAEVLSVDAKKNTLKVKGPGGKTKEIAVQDPSMRERLKTLKPGEVVELVYTEAMAITLEPAGK
jgi:hypothetical protein